MLYNSIYENNFTSTLNALSLQLLGASPSDLPLGALPLHTRWWPRSQIIHSPLTPTPASAT